MAGGLTLVIAKASAILFEIDVAKSTIRSGKITMEQLTAPAKIIKE